MRPADPLRNWRQFLPLGELPAGDFVRIDDFEATTWHDLDRLVGWSFADVRF